MCLLTEEKETKKLLHSKKEVFKFYKVLYVSNNASLYSIYYYKKWRSGVNKSNSKIKATVLDNHVYIDNGIHVLRSKKAAKQYIIDKFFFSNNINNKIIVPVCCNKEDLIGAKKTEAVFKKVTVLKEDYDKIRKVKRKRK